MVEIIEDEVQRVRLVSPGTAPDYDKRNPVWQVLRSVEALELQAEREHYLADRLEHLLPIAGMALYGPSGDAWQVADPRQQDEKSDFQKQNVAELRLRRLHLARGYASAGDWTGAFLHLAFAPGAGSPLLAPDGTYRHATVGLYLEVGGASTGTELLSMPYDEVTGLYSLELWAHPGPGLEAALGAKGQSALRRGAIQARPDLVRGQLTDFEGPPFDGLRDGARDRGTAVEPIDVAPDHLIHPVRPLRLAIAFTDPARERWDPGGGRNHVFTFHMRRRGWRHYLSVGQSANPHGGVGSLEFRNLFSNYFGHEAKRRAAFGADVLPELGRDIQPFNLDADGMKPTIPVREAFFAVDYVDLHLLKPNAAIGLHRHRDNQELFMVLDGKALMVTGDWAQPLERERALEVRTLLPGDMVLIKGGELHALANSMDENVLLFMFGGYD